MKDLHSCVPSVLVAVWLSVLVEPVDELDCVLSVFVDPVDELGCVLSALVDPVDELGCVLSVFVDPVDGSVFGSSCVLSAGVL